MKSMLTNKQLSLIVLIIYKLNNIDIYIVIIKNHFY